MTAQEQVVVHVGHSFSAKAIEVLRLVERGEPYAGRSKAGREAHLRYLERKGAIAAVSKPFISWALTDWGRAVLAQEGKKS